MEQLTPNLAVKTILSCEELREGMTYMVESLNNFYEEHHIDTVASIDGSRIDPGFDQYSIFFGDDQYYYLATPEDKHHKCEDELQVLLHLPFEIDTTNQPIDDFRIELFGGFY